MALTTEPGRHFSRFGRWFIGLLAVLMVAALVSPAIAHHHHDKGKPAEQLENHVVPGAGGSEAINLSAMREQMGEEMDKAERHPSSMSFVERLVDWVGRLHPIIVHFPLAFFPAALLTAIVGRRRPAFAAPVPFLVVAGGIVAPIAALLGWLDAISADPSALLTVHRWLGTAIGVVAPALALWAWRKPGSVRAVGMIVALLAITIMLVVQGWYGGAMVHGIDHLDW